MILFEGTGGRLCLNFINTLTRRATSAPVEHLNSYADMLAWSQQVGIIEEQESGRLQAVGEVQSEQAVQRLAEAREAREMFFRIFSALASEQAPRQEDIEQFNTLLATAMRHVCLVRRDDVFTWDWQTGPDRLGLPLWFVVRDAATLLTSPELSRVRICASDNCAWLFLDTSKNRSRRWCDMDSCGNRAKARRHYSRKKERAG
jgi:predicted RNA-binding Zn ribbon-like protein